MTGGTIALTGRLVVRADKVGADTQLGIFIKGYQALESSRAIDTVVLDKTGTVTTGQMTVTAVHGTCRTDLLHYAGSVEQASEHAVAAAITALARAESVPLASADGFEALAGLGARGVVDGHEVTIGRSKLFAEVPADLASWCRAREQAGCTTVLASWDDKIQGAIAVTDTINLARATFKTIRRNLAWAFCYNVLAIPLAALGFLNPLIAAATMTLSSVFVVWNSLRLRRFAAPRT